MKSGSVKLLAIIVILLFGVLFALNRSDQQQGEPDGDRLVPELKSRLNDIASVTITDADGQLTLVREDDAWRVREKAGYPADTAALRQLLLAVAEAGKVEKKTANPELYERLGVQHPDDGGDGVLVAASGPEFGFSLILGDSAQGDYRYARLPEQQQSWLIDRNPQLPDAVSGWLLSDIVDIPSADVRSVTLRHEDGETIRLHKESPADVTFTVEGIPEDRELSYPTVVDSIAGVLANLTLDDVAEKGADAPPPDTDVIFETFDGLRIEISARTGEEETWITLAASADAVASPEPGASSAAGDSDAAPGEMEGSDADGGEEDDGDGQNGDEEDAAAGKPSPEERAATINARSEGWRYRIADYKADQLTRRWEDLLKAESDED